MTSSARLLAACLVVAFIDGGVVVRAVLLNCERDAGSKSACPEGPEVPCEGRQVGARSWSMLPSTTCLEDLTLHGIVKGRKGYTALFESKATTPPKSFFLAAGSELFDATVVEVTGDTVVLHQTPGRPPDEKRCRTVKRRLRSGEGRETPRLSTAARPRPPRGTAVRGGVTSRPSPGPWGAGARCPKLRAGRLTPSVHPA